MTDAPRVLGDFEVLRELGRGGMGVVYEARQVSLNRRVALKVMSAPLGLTPQGVQRFRREAEAAAKLHHTNIVPVYASGVADGVPYYAMELVEGPSLDRVIKQLREGKGEASTLPSGAASTGPYAGDTPPAAAPPGSSHLSTDSHYFDQVARMVAGVADGLDHAHKNGVIHRDVKPSNLLLSPDGRLSINDFGLARVLEQPGMTMTGEFVGTPAYMSPEQITAGRTPLDHRTDLYSLGATLYEMLTLQPPFSGSGRDQVLAQIIHKEPKPPRRVNPKVPVDLETICLKTMEKDPDRRYQSAGALAEDLRRYLNRFGILARRTGPFGRLRKWVKRRPGLAAALAGVVLLAVTAGGIGYRYYVLEQQRQADQRRHDEEVRQEKVRAALDKALLQMVGGDFDAATASIAEAEKLGAAEGELELLRGQLADLHGEPAAAVIARLKRAVELLPDSVAARSLLAQAVYDRGGDEEYLQLMREVEAAPARSAEDFLHRGRAVCHLDSARALADLDESLRRRPTVVARLWRADLRLMILQQERLTVAGAERLLEDAAAARNALPGNPAAISVSIKAKTLAALAYLDAGRKPDYEAMIARALEDAREMERIGEQLEMVGTRLRLLREIGREAELLGFLRRKKATEPILALMYAEIVWRHGEAAEAVEALQAHAGVFLDDILRGMALCEFADGPRRARELYDEIARRRPTWWDAFNSLFILYMAGRPDEAAAAARDLLKRPERFPPIKPETIRRPLRFVAGEINAATFLRDSSDTSGEMCNAHFTVGMSLLARGDREGARKHFRAAQATRVLHYVPYNWSWVILGRMEKEPDWPKWIEAKE